MNKTQTNPVLLLIEECRRNQETYELRKMKQNREFVSSPKYHQLKLFAQLEVEHDGRKSSH